MLVDGWHNWAWRYPIDLRLIRDGGKVIEARPSTMDAQCGHSMEGWVSVSSRIRGLLELGPQRCTPSERNEVMAALGRVYWAFEDPARGPTAWHGTNMLKVNALIQHAPVHVRLVHAHAFNSRGPGYEHEGIAGIPIDGHQVATSLRVTRDLEAAYGRVMPWTEHNRHGPTACPSNRLAPLHAALAKKEDGMASAEYERLVSAIFGSDARIDELAMNTPVEGRLNRLERNDGPIGTRLAAIESELKRIATALETHRTAPHTADGLRGEMVDAFGAAAAFLNGED